MRHSQHHSSKKNHAAHHQHGTSRSGRNRQSSQQDYGYNRTDIDHQDHLRYHNQDHNHQYEHYEEAPPMYAHSRQYDAGDYMGSEMSRPYSYYDDRPEWDMRDFETREWNRFPQQAHRRSEMSFYNQQPGWRSSYDGDRNSNSFDSGNGRYPTYANELNHSSGKGPKGYRRSDERVCEDVCEALSYRQSIDASDVEVNVNDGIVTLSGSVESRQMKRKIEDTIDSVSGVRDVKNEIKVQSSMGTTSGSGATSNTTNKMSGSSQSSKNASATMKHS